MRLLVVSDNHGDVKVLENIVKKHHDEIDLMVHCGDSEFMHNHPLMEKCIKVRGNCDFDATFPLEEQREVDGKLLWVCHGHQYRIKMSAMSLVYRAEELGADLVCFGHTHVPVTFMERDTIFMNPGSLTRPRGFQEGTYIICEIKKESVSVDFYTVNGDFIDELSQCYSLHTEQKK